MSKRVSIVLPDEMPSGWTRSRDAPKPRPELKSSLKNPPSFRSDPVPPVFVVVSPESSFSSEGSSQRTSTSFASDSSLNNWAGREFSNVGFMEFQEEATAATEATAERSALVRTGSSNSHKSNDFESSGSSIKEFLRNTVALVRAGESFTSVKHLFYNFIKTSSGSSGSRTKPVGEVTQDSSASTSQLVRRENPYLSQSNDTLLSNCPPQFTIPSTSQMTPCTYESNYSFNPRKYDMSSRFSDVTPLTGYTPKTEEAGSRSDVSQKTNASNEAHPKSPVSDSILMPSTDLVKLPCRSLEKYRTPRHPRGKKIKILPGQVESTALVSAFPKMTKLSPKSSPRRSPKMTPRSDPTLEPTFVLVSSSGPHSQDDRSQRSSGSARQSARNTPKVSPRNSVISGLAQIPDEAVGEESKGERVSRSSEMCRPENVQQKSEISSLKVNFVFALVSPEEADASQPGETDGKDVEEASTCRTYQEHCCCHHCQDMRRAVKRVEYFQSPQGQKQMEAKLLAKNFFMDLCALSEVRKQIRADLHGTRRHPPARVSYPVSICGATRLDGGSLTLNWFTHDLDCVDHFDFFVDDKKSRSVFNPRATSTVLIDVNASQAHRLRMRAVPVRGCGAQASPVDKLMSKVAAGHMRHVRQGKLFASCLKCLDAQPQQRSLVDFWTDSEFLYMPTCDRPPSKKGR